MASFMPLQPTAASAVPVTAALRLAARHCGTVSQWYVFNGVLRRGPAIVYSTIAD
jgi:hypothetical protein